MRYERTDVSESSEPGPVPNSSQGIAMRERLLVVAVLVGMLGAVALCAFAGGATGMAFTEKPSGAITGGVIGVWAFIVALHRLASKHHRAESGCVHVIFAILVVAAYLSTQRVDARVEELRSSSAIGSSISNH